MEKGEYGDGGGLLIALPLLYIREGRPSQIGTCDGQPCLRGYRKLNRTKGQPAPVPPLLYMVAVDARPWIDAEPCGTWVRVESAGT
jgi:hypothetical protein